MNPEQAALVALALIAGLALFAALLIWPAAPRFHDTRHPYTAEPTNAPTRRAGVALLPQGAPALRPWFVFVENSRRWPDMPREYTCCCGLYVHPLNAHTNPRAIHSPGCEYA